MKQLYKVLPVVLSVGLFGCGSNNTATTTTTPESTTPPVTETKEEFVSKLPDTAPIVRVSADANYAPYGFNNEYGNITGFDIEVMQQIGEDQGFKVEFYSDLWKDAFNNIDNKSRDMIAAGASYSDERASKYLLSNPYAPLPTTLLYVDDSFSINSLDDLSNVRIGVLNDTVQYDYFTQGDVKVKSVEPYLTTFAAVQAMAQGDVDAVAEDGGVLRYIMNDLPDLNAQYFDYESLDAEAARKVLIVDKSQPELLDKLNSGLKNLKENGTYSTLTTKWFGTDLTESLSAQEKLLSNP